VHLAVFKTGRRELEAGLGATVSEWAAGFAERGTEGCFPGRMRLMIRERGEFASCYGVNLAVRHGLGGERMAAVSLTIRHGWGGSGWLP
jgi:hypothetical protein